MSGYLQKPGGGGGVTDINGLTGAVTLSAGSNMSLNELGNDIEFNANFTQQGKYMISGGAIWSGTGLVYDVSFLNYFFDGLKTANPTQVTLAASDPTFNRIDAIVVDEAGVVTVITGDADASPVEPAIPEDQLQVQFVLVAAGSTTPTVATENIYLDDPTTDWTFSTYTTGAATGSINFAGTNSPFQGVNDIEASTDARLGARFVKTTSFDPYLYTMYQVRVRFTGTAVASNKSLNVRFENSAGTLVGSTVNLFSYGLQRGVLNTWQLVVVPITAFGALPATVKGLKMIMAGGTVGVARQWDVDYMLLTDGSTPFTNIPTIAFYKDNVGIASQSGLNLIEGTGVTITAVNDPTNQRVNYTIDASGTLTGTANRIPYFDGSGNITSSNLFTRNASSGNMLIKTGNTTDFSQLSTSSTLSRLVTQFGSFNDYSDLRLSTSSAELRYGLSSDVNKISIASDGIHFNFSSTATDLLFPTSDGSSGQALVTDGAGKLSFSTVGVSDGDKGDITVSGSGTVWTIDTGAVTLPQISSSGASSGNAIVYNGSSIAWGTPASSITADATYNNLFSGTLGSGAALNGGSGGINSIMLNYQAGQNVTTGNNNNFLGYQAGKGPTTGVSHSNFIGYQTGLNATSATNSNFLGRQAGSGATSASFANFFGRSAGLNATGAQYGIFIGDNAGNAASGSNNGVFIGQNAGYQATTAPYSIFIGTSAGYQATGATTATFIGYAAGYTASNADYSNFIGRGAGNAATNAFYSQFMGFQAGYNATNAANAIFIGSNSGFGDTVDNTVSGTSILIGNNTSTGGFSNSIAIGKSATNTAANQMQIGSTSSKIDTVIVNGTGGIQVPVGTTAERIATQGMIRYNTTTSKFEGYDGAVWNDFY